jgi:hypothetical protein
LTLSNPEISLLFRLLIAHMLSDYFFQSAAWATDKGQNKIRSKKLYIHILVTFICAWALGWHFGIALFIAATHFVIDLGKVYLKFNRFVLFVLDQVLHTLMIVIAWLFVIHGWEWFGNTIYEFALLPQTWAFIFAYGVISFPMSIVIDIFIFRWRSSLTEEKQHSLYQAGHWIGVLERILVLTFILMGHFSAMGFLIATKAILRFKDTEIKQMEYVLIGTLMSLTPTIILGILLQLFINL